MAKLALRHCTPIKKGTTPISTAIARSLIKQLSPSWSFNHSGTGVEQEFRFKNFHETMGFVNAVAWIANTEDHHPDLEVSSNRCKITFTTHAAGGLTVNDFICAAKVDAIYQGTLPEATIEKTQAIIEARPKTGTIPRPAPKSAELNMAEAEELLNIEIKAPAPEPADHNDGDEIELSDPDNEPTLPHLQGKAVFTTGAAKASPEPAAIKDEPRSTNQGNQAEDHLLTTMILPPGMHNIASRGHDADEEATVIVQPDLNDETHLDFSDEDEVKTRVMSGSQDQTEFTLDEENPDQLKTVIIKPPLLDEDEAHSSDTGADETVLFNPRSPGKNKTR